MKMSVILKYLQAFGWSWMWLTIAAYLGQNAVAIGQNLWLSTWTAEAKQLKHFTEWKQLRNYRLGIYGLLGFIQGKPNLMEGKDLLFCYFKALPIYVFVSYFALYIIYFALKLSILFSLE